MVYAALVRALLRASNVDVTQAVGRFLGTAPLVVASAEGDLDLVAELLAEPLVGASPCLGRGRPLVVGRDPGRDVRRVAGGLPTGCATGLPDGTTVAAHPAVGVASEPPLPEHPQVEGPAAGGFGGAAARQRM